MKTQTKARVQITVDVDGGSPWDNTCTQAQIYRQAKESAINTLQAALTRANTGSDIRIVNGTMKVIAIITEQE